METDYKLFYSSYLKEFHLVKAINLKKAIAERENLDTEIKKFEFHDSLTNNTQFILQADLRQNYFHSIETFFEFFFALLPNKGNIPDNTKILKRLVKSNWRKNYKKIENIANGKLKLNFLDEIIEFNGHKVTVGHYMFYLGVFSKEKFSKEIFLAIERSIDAVKSGIIEIAKDFAIRDEYNAYKHALRIFPSFEALYILNAETKEIGIKWDISNSLSFQTYDEKKDKTSVKTKLFDSDRDFKMTHFCSNMIHNIIYFREIVFCDNSNKREENKKVAIKIFDKESIAKCKEYNVEIQNLEFTTQLINKGNS